MCVRSLCRPQTRCLWRVQGRFSGRLETKSDEKQLADECRLLGPMLGGTGKRGEKSRLTLAKIVRGIAAGDVRRFCESRENMLRVSNLAPELHRLRAVRQKPTSCHRAIVPATYPA